MLFQPQTFKIIEDYNEISFVHFHVRMGSFMRQLLICNKLSGERCSCNLNFVASLKVIPEFCFKTSVAGSVKAGQILNIRLGRDL